MWNYVQIRKFFTTIRTLCKIQEVAEFSNSRNLVLESGSFAKLADGSVVASIGNTSVLVTAVGKARSLGSAGFIPLTVDYRQKYAAAGRIPTNFLRRELAPTEKEILTSRVIDRSIRPLFPTGFNFDTQLTCQLLAVDGQQEPDIAGINGASAALAISDIPWNGPIGAVRLGSINGDIIIFPTRKELADSSLNLIIAASDKSQIVMLEGSGTPVYLHDLKKAIEVGGKECQRIIKAIRNLMASVGKPKRECEVICPIPEEILAAARSLSENRIAEVFRNSSHNKLSRDEAITMLRMDVIQKLTESFPDADKGHFHQSFQDITKEVFRNLMLEEVRCDSRTLFELRPISCAVDLFKPLHGSSMFQRGQTQVQCTVAFDSPEKALSLDPLLEVTGGLKDRNFFLHYSFPSYANNELSRGGAVSRREIGHGALAAKGLMPLIPKNVPFTILLTSTVMESNGSSSMATVCGGSLALMDAGVDISSPAAGVAIGLVTKFNDKDEIENYKILTDILGIEDYFGDMDFKVAGTKLGVTAIQADIKLTGVPIKIILEALDRAIVAKNEIISIMNKTIACPRKDKENLPVTTSLEIPVHKRGLLMGPGGINIKKIQFETGVQISWQDNDNISVFAPNQSSMDEALQVIESFMHDEPSLEFGAIYTANIVEIRPQGLMVTLFNGMTPALMHNSQLDVKRVQHPSVLNFEVGQQIKVKYFGRDPVSGHMRLSRRALMASSLSMGTKNLHETDMR